jgi:hypothetical protein
MGEPFGNSLNVCSWLRFQPISADQSYDLGVN